MTRPGRLPGWRICSAWAGLRPGPKYDGSVMSPSKRARRPSSAAPQRARLSSVLFLQSVEKALTSILGGLFERIESDKSLSALLAVRYRARLAQLPRSKRQEFLQLETASLMSQPLDERAVILLHTWVLEAAVRNQPQENRPRLDLLRRWGYPPNPHIALREPHGGQTIVPLTTPLPEIQRRVADFVRGYRALGGIRVPRGRKPGKRGVLVDPVEAFLLAYLSECRGMTKAELLRLCGRPITSQDLRWLPRRLDVGHGVLARWQSDTLARMDSWPLKHIQGIILTAPGHRSD